MYLKKFVLRDRWGGDSGGDSGSDSGSDSSPNSGMSVASQYASYGAGRAAAEAATADSRGEATGISESGGLRSSTGFWSDVSTAYKAATSSPIAQVVQAFLSPVSYFGQKVIGGIVQYSNMTDAQRAELGAKAEAERNANYDSMGNRIGLVHTGGYALPVSRPTSGFYTAGASPVSAPQNNPLSAVSGAAAGGDSGAVSGEVKTAQTIDIAPAAPVESRPNILILLALGAGILNSF